AEGDGTAATLAFLKKSEAEKLRADIMERAAGRGPSAQRPGAEADLAHSAGSDDGAHAAAETSAAPGQAPYGTRADTAAYGVDPDAAGTPSGPQTSPGSPTSGSPTPDAGMTAAPEPVEGREIVRVPLGRLIGSVVCGWGTIAVLALLLVGVLSLAVGLIVGYFAGDDLASTMGAVSTVIGAISLPALIPAGIGILTVYYSQLSSGFGFTATMTSVGLRIRYGLLETTSQTVPPGRVQALLIQQPIVWRPFKWHRVLVVVAGYGAGEKRSLLLPVGTFEETMRITAEMFPDLAVDHPEEVFAEGLRGTGTEGGFTQGPRSARYFDPLARRRRGYLTTPSTLMFRDGRLNRQLTMVPHERIQSLSLDQGPLQRRAKLADIHVHSPAGPFRARLKNQSLDAVTWLFNAEAEQAAVARRLSNRHHWMTAQELQEFEKSITQSDAEDDPDSPRVPAGEGSVSG
ncbi:MAG TPA: PH domain-containing protein, partial [Candidatus Nesterenkonia stercoripullorum]|nr:PH domain-containing protein [Candidatus Nesterenkonia stercoripullorum]